MEQDVDGVPGRWVAWAPRASGRPYLALLLVGSVAGQWAGYLWPNQAVFKGQAPAVLVPLAFFGVAALMWLFLERRTVVRGLPLAFLAVLGIAWAVNLTLFYAHGDYFTHVAWLFLPVLAMFALKPPRVDEGVDALKVLAWSITVVLASTFALEKLGVLSAKHQPPGIIDFDEQYYWLPVNDLLGIEGRWPGPFGHNGYTAMMAALIIVIAFIRWKRSSWVFLAVGGFVLLITSGRASAGAAAAGIVIIAMLANTGPIARVSRRIRIPVGLLALVGGLVVMFSGKSGLTGRQTIWPAFAELWWSAPWTGVGSGGIAVSGGITQEFGHAHSLYLDLLARYGVLAFVPVMAALAIGVGIALAAGVRGFPGPLAVIAAYLITGVTEPRNDWIHPGTNVLMTIVCVMTAAACLRQAERLPAARVEQGEIVTRR